MSRDSKQKRTTSKESWPLNFCDDIRLVSFVDIFVISVNERYIITCKLYRKATLEISSKMFCCGHGLWLVNNIVTSLTIYDFTNCPLLCGVTDSGTWSPKCKFPMLLCTRWLWHKWNWPLQWYVLSWLVLLSSPAFMMPTGMATSAQHHSWCARYPGRIAVATTAGFLYTLWNDVLPQDLVKFRSREIRI